MVHNHFVDYSHHSSCLIFGCCRRLHDALVFGSHVVLHQNGWIFRPLSSEGREAGHQRVGPRGVEEGDGVAIAPGAVHLWFGSCMERLRRSPCPSICSTEFKHERQDIPRGAALSAGHRLSSAGACLRHCRSGASPVHWTMMTRTTRARRGGKGLGPTRRRRGAAPRGRPRRPVVVE